MNHPLPARVCLAVCLGVFLTATSTPVHASEIYWAETNSDAVFGASVVDGTGQRKIRDLDETDRGARSYNINEIAVFDNLLFITAPSVDRIFYTSPGDPAGLSGQFINLDNAFGNADYRPIGITANADHVYWTDANANKVYRADFGVDLRGRGAEEIITLPGSDPRPQSITVFGDDLYYVLDGRDEIYRSDLDGGNADLLISLDAEFGSGSYIPNSITATDRYIFWSDVETDIIYRADRDGGNAIELIDTDAGASDGPVGLTTDGSFLYWTTFLGSEDSGNEIFAATLDGVVEATPRFTPTNDPDPGMSGFNVGALAIVYVPEPTSLVLMGLGGLFMTRRRPRRD